MIKIIDGNILDTTAPYIVHQVNAKGVCERIMRFIRTTKSIYSGIQLTKNTILVNGKKNNRKYPVSLKNNNIIAQADTIEELIDCLTKKEPKHKHPELLVGKPNMYLKDERTLKYMTKRIKNKTIIISGCIWIGDNLIKVSELNEKGELELI